MFIYIHILSYYKLFIYFNLCPSVMLDDISCSFTSTSFLNTMQMVFLFLLILNVFGPTQTGLTPPLFIKLSLSSKESELSCICVLHIAILSSFYDFSFGFSNCSDSVVFI